MTKKKNKSFVEIKAKKNNQENIIDPLKQYEYIEPQKKLPLKKFLLVLLIVIAIALIIIFLKIIDTKSEKLKNNQESHKASTNSLNLLTTTSTTTITDNNNDEQNNKPSDNKVDYTITESLTCSSISIENGLQFETKVTANFNNRKLRSDVNYLKITLLEENARDNFNNYVATMKMFSIYLISDANYDIIDDTKDNEFSLTINTTYKQNQETESDLSFDEDYESVKQKLVALGHTCQ